MKTTIKTAVSVGELHLHIHSTARFIVCDVSNVCLDSWIETQHYNFMHTAAIDFFMWTDAVIKTANVQVSPCEQSGWAAEFILIRQYKGHATKAICCYDKN